MAQAIGGRPAVAGTGIARSLDTPGTLESGGALGARRARDVSNGQGGAAGFGRPRSRA